MQTAALAASWEYRWVQVSTRRGEKTEAISRYGLLVSSNREEVICSGSSSSTSESYLLIQAHQQGQQSTSSKAAVLLAPQCSHIPTRRNQQDCHAFSCGEKTFTKERLGHTLRSRTRFTIESQILKCCVWVVLQNGYLDIFSICDFFFFMLPLYQKLCDYSVIITTNMMAELSKDDYPVCSTNVRASELFWPMMCFYLASVSVIILPNRH